MGKTSLVERHVRSLYSDEYHTTLGVKIDKKVMRVNSTDVTCMLWDVAGEDEFYTLNHNYLRGMSGYFLVVDGTRGVTVEVARRIQQRIEVLFPRTPFVLIANKADLTAEWVITDDMLGNFSSWPHQCMETSAKTGEQVDAAFRVLIANMLAVRGAQ